MNENQVIAELSKRMDRLEASVMENTELTQDIKADTGEFLEIFKTMKGGFKFLMVLGNIVKWVAGLALPIAGIWYAMKNGGGGGNL
jgi:hypothetical protein